MSILDSYLQHLRDALGLKSNPQIDNEEANRSSYLRGGPSAYPGGDVQLPTVNMQQTPVMGPPREEVTDNRFPQEALLHTLGRAEFGAAPEGAAPRFEAGATPADDSYFNREGFMMTPQQTSDYIDFISPHQFDDEETSPAIAAMRRGR